MKDTKPRSALERGAPVAGVDADFDLVLVVEYFRTVTYFLSIIKYLGSEYRIGLYLVPVDPKQLAKQRAAQDRFVRLCVEYGAEIVGSRPVRTRVLVIPQRPYEPDALRDIRENIRAERTLGALGFAFAGQPKQDAFLKECRVDKALVIDRRLVEFLLENRGDRSPYEGLELAEVGLPYKRYPVFTNFSADYFLAIPTPWSFAHESDKWRFLNTVLSLFAQIDPSDSIVHKPHNSMDRDQFSTMAYRRAARLLCRIRGGATTARWLALRLPHWISKHFGRLYTAYLYERVLARTVSLADLSDHSDLALEAFLPGIRKGVIGGLSNTIWGTLHAGLPFYNCVDLASQKADARAELTKRKSLDQSYLLNLRFFAIPFCEGKLVFDPKHLSIVSESSRNGDLIGELDMELDGVVQR
jgi:hypothetical protein